MHMTWDYVFWHVDGVVSNSPESLDDRCIYGVELNYRVELLSSGLYRYYVLPEIGDDCVSFGLTRCKLWRNGHQLCIKFSPQ